MNFEPKRIAVVGATGPTRILLVRELVRRGWKEVTISRRRGHLEDLIGGEGVEIATADDSGVDRL